MMYVPSEENLFSKDKRTHDGYNDHHQRAKSCSKHWPFHLHHQSLDVV